MLVGQAQDQQRKGHDVQSKTKSYSAGETTNKCGPKGLPGVVIETEGSVLLRV